MVRDDGKYKFYFIAHEESAAIVHAIAQNRIVDGIYERIQHNMGGAAPPTTFKIKLWSGGESDAWHVERPKDMKILGGLKHRIEHGKYEIANNDSHTKAKIDYLENDFETRVAKELLDVWHRCSIGCVISVGPNEYARATQQGWVAAFDGRPTTWQRLLIRSSPHDSGTKRRSFGVRGDGALLDRTFTIESVSEWKVDDPKPYIEHALTNRKYARAFIGVISKCESWNAQIQEIMQAVIRAYTDGQDRIRHWSNIGPGKRPTDLPPTDIDAATLRKVNAGLAWIGAMRSVCSHESTKLKIRGKGEEPLAWEDVDDRVMAQRIRANDSVIIFEVIGLANYGVKCSIEITSAAQDIRSFMCRETLWMDPNSIETWMGRRAMGHRKRLAIAIRHLDDDKRAFKLAIPPLQRSRSSPDVLEPDLRSGRLPLSSRTSRGGSVVGRRTTKAYANMFGGIAVKCVYDGDVSIDGDVSLGYAFRHMTTHATRGRTNCAAAFNK
ncbi:uncharacterized protein ACA1_122740 [Acanthamoeba castellanii str. Neff]|uniref:Uncharacterized protein n=1 Tax=Acanthamoeba castellanii (strain ATCC 30010 / Neff) TaxID=1257118 RepID=L8GH06_ACACF|nr:uncharacterized protein ACA1_122740 [Acanthamoeba castellanii str. Neff]ELR11481.1 hypothetical protein ACA1_122740 [Acanthamoeba castellanii str. Neff]